MVKWTENTHQVSPIPCVRGVILVPSGSSFRLREDPLPLVRPLTASAPLLSLRGGAIASSTVPAVGGARGLHCGDRVALILQVILGTSGAEGQGTSGVWAPWRGWQRPVVVVGGQLAVVVAFGLLIGTAVVPDSLGLHALQDGASAVGAAGLQRGAQPLVFRPRALALRLGQTRAPPQPPKLDIVSADDPSLHSGNVNHPAGTFWLTVWQRLIHVSSKASSSLLTHEPCS